jgi:hypothetical protein
MFHKRFINDLVLFKLQELSRHGNGNELNRKNSD